METLVLLKLVIYNLRSVKNGWNNIRNSNNLNFNNTYRILINGRACCCVG